MYSNKQAFTLIELLVVVLIIGILASVALPQYKVAVMKSRLAAIQPLLREIKSNQELAYLTTGNYAGRTDKALLNIPDYCTNPHHHGVWSCGHSFMINFLYYEISAISAYYCPNDTDNYANCKLNADFLYSIYLDHSEYPGTIVCSGSTKLGLQLCKTVQQ